MTRRRAALRGREAGRMASFQPLQVVQTKGRSNSSVPFKWCSHWVTHDLLFYYFFLPSASKVSIEPNVGNVDVSPKTTARHPTWKPPDALRLAKWLTSPTSPHLLARGKVAPLHRRAANGTRPMIQLWTDKSNQHLQTELGGLETS